MSMKTVLIVDDSETMRTLLRGILEEHGMTVTGEAENGKAGVEKYKELLPDIVFMDIMMEEMGGMEALKRIISHNPDAVVIMSSSVGGQSFVADEAVKEGARAVMVKPPNAQSVVDAIGRAMTARRGSID